MSYNSDVHDQAYQFFIEEVPELLQAIEAGLFALTQDFNHNNIHEVMRAAHSIKGGAAMVELDEIKIIAHRLEDSVRALFNEDVSWDSDLENLLFQGFDCLRSPLLDQLDIGEFDKDSALANADLVFQHLEAHLGEALAQTENYVPSSSDSGFDMVASIFEVDVQQGIERLEAVLANPEPFEVTGELRAQAEVFIGFADLFKLPGFGSIAATALVASENHPSDILEVIQLAIEDFRQSREIVLGGDRQQGGTPCPRLIEIAGGLQNIPSEPIQSGLLVDNSENFDGSEIFDSGEIFDGGEVFDSGEIFDGGEVFDSSDDSGEIFDGGEVFDSSDDSGEIFDGGEVFDDSDDSGEIFDGSEVFDSSEIFDGGEVFDSSDDSGEIFDGGEVFDDNDNSGEIFDSSDDSGEVFDGGEIFDDGGEVFEKAPTHVTSNTAIHSSSGETSEETSPLHNHQSSLRTSSQKVSSKQSKLAKKTSQPSTSLSVRVDMNRLERMSNTVSELVINRNSLALQNEGLQRTLQNLVERFEHLSEIVRDVQVVRAKMAAVLPMDTPIASHSSQAIPPPKLPLSLSPVVNDIEMDVIVASTSADNTEFDPLEMDRYSVLDEYFQDLLEESAQIEESLGDAELFAKQSTQSLLKQRQMLRQIRDEMMWARMFPLGNLLNRFPRMVRELSATYQKQVSLKVVGVGVLIDKAVIEKLYDPLFHLIRNAFSHGIEFAEERQQTSKPEQGTIEIQAYHQGNETVIEVRDDGKGIDLQAIAQKAIENGQATPTQVATWTQTQLTELIFSPGFSTTRQANELSGRGVGLDVVRSRVEELKGSLTLETELGKGTTFSIRLPLTLTLANLLITIAESAMMAFYSDSIEEVIIPQIENLKDSGGQRYLYRGEKLIQIHRLSDLVQYNNQPPTRPTSEGLRPVKMPKEWTNPLLILRRGQQLVALEIDQLVTEEELVIKPFGAAIASPPYTYGCAIFGDGTLIPVLDALALIEYVTGNPKESGISIRSGATAPLEPIVSEVNVAPTILVIDDSTAFRRTLALSLEKAGYLVVQARDGQEGLEQLKSRSDIRLVICDVEMPNMNGFEFLNKRRNDEKIATIPVAMLTSRSNDKHRQLATQLGANHYFTKPYIAREFLNTIETLIQN